MGTSTVFNIDCLEYMRTLPDKAFDLLIADPPYGLKEHGGKSRSGYVKQKNGSMLYVNDGSYEKMDWDKSTPSQEYIDEMFWVSKHQIIWGANYLRLPPGGAIVWDKVNDGTDQSDCEIAFCSLTKRVDMFRFMWRGMMQGKSISEGSVQQGDKSKNEARIHPTQKPVALYVWLLQKFAQVGWKIFDPYLGSGSSRIAAYELGFDFVGCEKNTKIFKAAEERFAKHSSQINLFLEGEAK